MSQMQESRRERREQPDAMGIKLGGGTFWHRFHYAIAGGVALFAFLMYLSTMPTGVLPGSSAATLVGLSGIEHNLVMRFVLWRKFIQLAIGLGGSSWVTAVNVAFSVVSALAVGAMYLVGSSLVSLMLDAEHYEVGLRRKAKQDITIMSVLAGIFSSLILAFAAPFWASATQPHLDSFHLFLLLVSIFLALRYVSTFQWGYCIAFCVLHGVGMSQTSSFVGFAPLLYLMILVALWRKDRFSVRIFWELIVWTLIGFFVVLCWNALEFSSSEGAAWIGMRSFPRVAKRIVLEVLRGVFGSLPRVGWLILLGTTVAPCLAILLTGRRALNGKCDWSFYALHVIVLAACLLVILDTRVSPWQIYQRDSFQTIPYAMMALTFGYVVAYLYAQTILYLPSDNRGTMRNGMQVTRILLVVLASFLLGFSIANNRRDANHKRMQFVWMYADALLDNLEGRTWLLTNGVFDDMVRVRAKERGIQINMLNLSKANNRIEKRRIKAKFDNIRLKNSVEIGLFPLVQEWISGEREVASQLGLCLYPDLWNFGDYEVYPNGFAFFGTSSDEMKSIAERDWVEPFLAQMKRFAPALDQIGTEDTPRRRFYAQMVKSQLSFVGNNLGYLLETFGSKTDAFTIYHEVHKFDENNISALLNFASMIQAGFHPELKDQAMADLEAFQRRLTAPLEIWSLSRTFGYVSSPEAFARLGWTWAMSGQSNLALKSLNRALKDIQPEKQNKLRAVMANIYMQNHDRVGSERVYQEILDEDPGDHNALIGMVRINVMEGRPEKAQEYLNLAKKAGVPRQRLLYETIGLELSIGELDRARIIAQEMMEMDPNNVDVYVVLSSIASQLYADATSPEQMKEAEASMLKAVEEMTRISGADDFKTLFVRGRMNLVTQNFAEARENFRAALRRAPNPNVVPLLESILTADHALVDKDNANRTARMILHRDPKHAYANYILGSLALEREEYHSAEDFLEQALETSPKGILILNDLAVAKLHLKKYAEAERLIRRSFETDNQVYAAWDTLGEILLAQDDINGAFEAFQTAVKLNDNDLRVHLHIAQVHYRRGELEKSRDIIRRLAAGADVFIGEDLKQYQELSQALLGRISE